MPVGCSELQCVAVSCSVLQCVAVCCSVLQCVAVCCSVLQCVAVYCSHVSALNTVCKGARHARIFHLHNTSVVFATFKSVNPKYRVAKTHRMLHLYNSFSAKEPYN